MYVLLSQPVEYWRERKKFKESAGCLLLNVKNLALIFCFDSSKSATDISIRIAT